MRDVYIAIPEPSTREKQLLRILLTVLQLISELDVTGGDEKKVGYYAGRSRILPKCQNTDHAHLQES